MDNKVTSDNSKQMQEKVQRIEQKLTENPLLWGYAFFPRYFSRELPLFHLNIINSAVKFDKLAIAAPRGSAKSTILAFLYVFHQIMFNKQKYIVLIGNTEDKATEHLNAMKSELKDNDDLKQYMSCPKLEKDTQTETIFSFKNGYKCKVLCKGVNQIPSIRGTRFGPHRPTLILGDDMEDDEMVRSRQRRDQIKEELDDVLKYAGDDGTRFVFIGTILHDDSQIAKFLDPEQYTQYKKLFYQALDEEKDTSLWDDKWKVDELKQMRALDPRSFAKEMQNDPTSGGEIRFHRENFRYWRINYPYYELLDLDASVTQRGFLSDCRGAVACDLAWSERKDADQSVLLGALLTPGRDLLVLQYLAERGLRPDRFAHLLFRLVGTIEGYTEGVVPVGFEKAMLEKVSQWVLKQEMRRRNKFLICKQLKWEHDKITRIETMLEPRYANQVIYHRHGMGDLEHQLVRFPRGVHDDIIDALQGVCQILKQPKGSKKPDDYDDGFEFWRKQAQSLHKPTKKPYVFGKKTRPHIPYNTTYK